MTKHEYTLLKAKLYQHEIGKEDIKRFIVEAVKSGNINDATFAFQNIKENDDPLLMLYRGRYMSQCGEFKDLAEYNNYHSDKLVRKELSEGLSPWYWRLGMGYAFLNDMKNSRYYFDKHKDLSLISKHELAHYYQCFGAVSLAKDEDNDKAEEMLYEAIDTYFKCTVRNEPFYTTFDNERCIIVNIILQAIYHLKINQDYIAYKKLLYCRRWIIDNRFSINATGIAETTFLFRNKEFGWVFKFLFANNNELLNNMVPDTALLGRVYEDYRSIYDSRFDTTVNNLSTIKSDYLNINDDYLSSLSSDVIINHRRDIKMSLSQIFIIHGRNKGAYDGLHTFLTSLRLDPIEWVKALSLTGKPSPYIGEVIDAAFKNAQAIIVLLTPDEEVHLKKEYLLPGDDDKGYSQARPNVIYEAGAAISKYPERTILVQMGDQKLWSDISGIHVVKIDNTPVRRQELANRLITAGCPINLTSSNSWMTQGNLEL